MWIKLFQLFKFVSKNNSVIIRLTYIGATLGATTGVGTGVGKHLCNLLIIKLGVRGVTKHVSVCASGGHVGHKVTTANEAEDGDTVVLVQDA